MANCCMLEILYSQNDMFIFCLVFVIIYLKGKGGFVMSIGKNIAKYRKLLGYTQEELGAKLGVTNQSVSKWESEVSMPDVMLLPEIAKVLCISLENIYGIKSKIDKVSISADEFPVFCQRKLHELFYHNAGIKFTHIDSDDASQFDFQTEKIKNGCRIGCFSNEQGAVIMTDTFSFIDSDYKASGSEKVIKNRDNEYTLMYLTDINLRKVLFFQYKTAFERSKAENTEFSIEEIMNGCNLNESEANLALRNLKEININEIYIDQQTKTERYVFKMANAIYAIAIYKLAGMLSEDDPVWVLIRDTSMINDYAFGL